MTPQTPSFAHGAVRPPAIDGRAVGVRWHILTVWMSVGHRTRTATPDAHRVCAFTSQSPL
jgi:hypothetical protein